MFKKFNFNFLLNAFLQVNVYTLMGAT